MGTNQWILDNEDVRLAMTKFCKKHKQLSVEEVMKHVNLDLLADVHDDDGKFLRKREIGETLCGSTSLKHPVSRSSIHRWMVGACGCECNVTTEGHHVDGHNRFETMMHRIKCLWQCDHVSRRGHHWLVLPQSIIEELSEKVPTFPSFPDPVTCHEVDPADIGLAHHGSASWQLSACARGREIA